MLNAARIILAFAVFTVPIAGVAQSDAAQAAVDGTYLTEEAITQLDAFLQEHNAQDDADPANRAPGLVLLVDTPDGQYLKAVGVRSLETLKPLETSDVFEIGSNSKSFTIVLLMQLQEQGILSIDQKLSEWLPEWVARIPNGDEISLKQLAQHTSGIWDYADQIITNSVESPGGLGEYFSPEQLVQYAIDNGKPGFLPGAAGQWKYTNTGYILLGMIIEKAAGEPLGDLYKTRIFDPLSLNSANFLARSPERGEILMGITGLSRISE